MGWFWRLTGFMFFFLNHCLSYSSSTLEPAPLCHPRESAALLSFKNSFPITNYPNFYFCGDQLNGNSTVLWDMDEDCCSWSGVTCDELTNHVVGLELHCAGIQGVIDSNNTLFFLTHLQTLDLSYNGFEGSVISPHFGRFPSLMLLNLSGTFFTGQVPPELAYLSNLRKLDLSLNNELRLETNNLKRIVANLTSLTDLYLSFVPLSHVLPNWMVNLSTSLISLDLSHTGLTGIFPENILRLPNLEYLSLYYNKNLSGTIPPQNWTSPLKILVLSQTGFLIDLPQLTSDLKYLNHLEVRNCSFLRSFPASFDNLTELKYLDISSNHLGGQIPWASLNLEKLIHLDLSGNNFKDQLPEICTNSTKKMFFCDSVNHQLLGPIPLNLEKLSLDSNFLYGIVPSWLYSLPSLVENLSELDLSSNNLSGVVVLENFSKFRNLKYLSLSFNSLSVVSNTNSNDTLPDFLDELLLASCNITEFPYSLRNLEHLRSLDLSNNRIEGNVPDWLWNVGKNSLVLLNVSHNFLTHIGQVPWKSLVYVDLRSNQIQGQLPIFPPGITFVFASNNQFSGGISTLLCNLSFIQVVDLSNNSLSGDILPCLGNFSNSLSVLDLRMNKFDGVIPSAFAKGSSFTTLNLNGNRLEGLLPQSLLNCEMLEVLDVANNKLNGSFPQFLESLPELRVLILKSNRFGGAIPNPKIRLPFQNLKIIDLSRNEFAGDLPAKYFGSFKAMIGAHSNKLEYLGDLKTTYYQDSVVVSLKGNNIELVKIQNMFITIDFSRNKFTGTIPNTIGMLDSLKGLNFSHNKLSGEIPTSLGNLSNLESLDLSWNELVGKIPWQLAANLYQLQDLNLSNNKLEGPIPCENQFQTFTNDSYEQNMGLCGFPLTKLCSEDKDRQDFDDEGHGNGTLDWKLVMMIGYASGLVIGISIGYMVFFSQRFDRWLAKKNCWRT